MFGQGKTLSNMTAQELLSVLEYGQHFDGIRPTFGLSMRDIAPHVIDNAAAWIDGKILSESLLKEFDFLNDNHPTTIMRQITTARGSMQKVGLFTRVYYHRSFFTMNTFFSIINVPRPGEKFITSKSVCLLDQNEFSRGCRL
jgi:hypothetical protein